MGAVLRSHRKLGIATKLMRSSIAAMEECFSAEHVSLHVRYTNRAAFTLYSQTLGFEIHDIEKGYYADKEDAYDMRKLLAAGRRKKEEAGKGKKKNEAIKEKEETEAPKKDSKAAQHDTKEGENNEENAKEKEEEREKGKEKENEKEEQTVQIPGVAEAPIVAEEKVGGETKKKKKKGKRR